MKRKIYVASSWRNEHYPEVVEKLREAADLGFNCFYIEPYLPSRPLFTKALRTYGGGNGNADGSRKQ